MRDIEDKIIEDLIKGNANEITDLIIDAMNDPGGFDNIQGVVEDGLEEFYMELKKVEHD